MRFPFLVPKPVRLSAQTEALASIENSGWFTNFGPVNTRFETDLVRALFDGKGSCVTTANATLALMLAIRHVTRDRKSGARYALMPAFTFAAAAHAVDWCGLTPLFCDIDPGTWTMDPGCAEELLKKHKGEIAVLFPYATFGNFLDISPFEKLATRHSIPLVVDAAASLGSFQGSNHFGKGSKSAIVFSMHATKAFSTAEGGLVYSSDKRLIDSIRSMSNFGFDSARVATQPGLNAKLSEVGALLCTEKLKEFPQSLKHRQTLFERYQHQLKGLQLQTLEGDVPAYQLLPGLLDASLVRRRDSIVSALAKHGLETRTYFFPTLEEHPYFANRHEAGKLDVTKDISHRILNLPLNDSLSVEDVDEICELVHQQIESSARRRSA